MADQKVSDLPSLSGADVDAADLLYIIDSSAGSAGSKKITVGQYQLAPVSGGTANGVMYLDGSKVATAGSDLVFDGTNLGLGVTPSAWSGVTALQIAGSGAIGFNNQYGEIDTNAYYNAGYKYIGTGLAAKYDQSAGQHRWFTAPTGTAGNAIAFTQAMTLDASANLLVGTTATTGGRATISAVANYGDLATGYSLVLSNIAGTGSNSNPINVGLIQFGNPTLTNSDEGRISVVQESPSASTASSMRFFTNGGGGNTQTLERARITSAGDLLVGTTTTPSSSNAGFVVAKDADGTYLRNACTITTTRTHFEFVNGNGTVGTVSTNASATAYNTSSDRRLKEGIAPAADAGPIIDAIEIVQHDWKVGGHTRFGVIAQDLNAVAPEAVSAGDDGDEIEKTWGVDYSKLVPMLIKEIQTLRARVAALESA